MLFCTCVGGWDYILGNGTPVSGWESGPMNSTGQYFLNEVFHTQEICFILVKTRCVFRGL